MVSWFETSASKASTPAEYRPGVYVESAEGRRIRRCDRDGWNAIAAGKNIKTYKSLLGNTPARCSHALGAGARAASDNDQVKQKNMAFELRKQWK